jgi:hypothetical protein
MNSKDPFQNLIALFHLFNGLPELLAQKLIQFSALHPDFLQKVIENQHLTAYANDPNKPYFNSLKDVHTFYDKFFTSDNIKQLPMANDPIEILHVQLKKFVDDERYELAEMVKKYMQLINVDIKYF